MGETRRKVRREPEVGRDVAAAKRRRQHPEHDEQVRLVTWARTHEDLYPPLRLLHAIPNGGFRAPKTAALMKAEGALAGIPDLCLPHPRRLPDGAWTHGLYIEMKAEKGRLSPAQGEIAALLREGGYRVVVCRSKEEAVEMILDYLGGNE